MFLGAWLAPWQIDEEVALALGGLTAFAALAMLIRWVRRLRREALAPAVPVLRRLVSGLVVAYPAGILLLLSIFVEPWSQMDEDVAIPVFLAIAVLAVAAPWAVSVAGWSVVERLTLWRKCWLMCTN